MISCSAVLLLILSIQVGSIWSQSCSNPDADVLILGGGISGITAANRLSRNGGVNNFLVLEALPQIGGRIQQRNLSPNVKVEIGANWIHDIDPSNPTAHPLGEVLNLCQISLQNFGTRSNYEDLTVYDSEGNEITNDLLSTMSAYNNALMGANARANRPSTDTSVRQGLSGQGWTPSTSQENWVEWFGFDFCFAEPPDATSLYFTSSRFLDESIPDEAVDFFVTSPGGYVQIVDCLADEFFLGEDDTRIHLNTTVTRVEWSDDCVCAQVTENGQPGRYCAPYAISTFSIGVLQSDARDTLFDPELPQWKTSVIDDKFSMTHYLKIFAEFDTRFWELDASEFVGHVADDRGYFAVFQPLHRFLDGDVLLATLTGENADRVARLPMENITAELVDVLRNIYGPNVREPTNIIVPDWEANSLFRGTYSSIPVGGGEGAFSELARPVGRLYFSGEATSERSSGTVHGGYLAGINSANIVIQARQSGATPQAVLSTSSLIACLLFSYCLYLLL